MKLIPPRLRKEKNELHQVFCFKLLKVPPAKLITNSFLRDLDKIWALRFIIPDPKKHKWILNDVL